MIIFNKPNISPNIFGIILKKFYNLMNFICKKFLLTNFFFQLRYIYTGELDLDYKSEVDLLELLVASVDLILEELINCLQDYFIEKRVSWIQQN